MTGRWLAVLLLAAPMLAQAVPGAAAEEFKARAERLAKELAASGLVVDLDALEPAVLPRTECRALALEELRQAVGEPRAELWRLLLQEHGRAHGSGTELLEELSRDMARRLPALYLPGSKRLVAVAEELSVAGEEALDVALLAALAQAARHQAGAALFDAPVHDLDAVLARRALLEGGAIAAAQRALEARDVPVDAGAWIESLGLSGLETECRLAGYETLAPVESEEALTRLWNELGSGEQALHVLKRTTDQPVAVELPPWPEKLEPGERVFEDTVGELGIRALLLEFGVPRTRAQVAAVGWDGDRIAHERTADGKHVLRWRTVWDRPKDAQQFAEELRLRFDGQARLGGRVVDWVLAEGNEKGVWNKILKTFEAAPFEWPESEDEQAGKSTQRIEKQLTDRHATDPYVWADEWRHPRLDLTVVVPVGWYELDDGEVTYLVREKTAGFRDNVHVVPSPVSDARTIDAILEINERRLRADKGFEFLAAEKRVLSGTEVGVLRYTARNGGHEIVYATLVVLNEERQIGVTVAFDATRSEDYAEIIEAILNGVRLGPVPARDD